MTESWHTRHKRMFLMKTTDPRLDFALCFVKCVKAVVFKCVLFIRGH